MFAICCVLFCLCFSSVVTKGQSLPSDPGAAGGVTDSIPGNVTAAAHVLSPKLQKEAEKLRRKYNLEKIGNRGVGSGLNLYSAEKEIRLGNELAEQIESSSVLVTDPELVGYVTRIGQNLIANSDSQRPLIIKILDDGEANAFALPGGLLYVTTGLIEFCDDEAELAAAISHEIAHVAARHGTKALTRQNIWKMASVPMVFAGGPIGAALQMVGDASFHLTVMKLGRNAELEADLLGLEYHYLAGYDPVAFVRLFEKTKAEVPKANFFGRAFATHPDLEIRVRRAQFNMEALLPAREMYVLDTSDFQEAKAHLEGLQNPVEDDSPRLRKSTQSNVETEDEEIDDTEEQAPRE